MSGLRETVAITGGLKSKFETPGKRERKVNRFMGEPETPG